MSPAALLQRMTRAGVRLTAAGDRLRVHAPGGVLTDDDRAALREAKPALLALLTPPAERCAACERHRPLITMTMTDGTELCSRCWRGLPAPTEMTA